MTSLNPAVIFLLAGLFTPFAPESARRYIALGAPITGVILLLLAGHGNHGQVELFNLQLVTYRLDKLAFVWALIFHIAAFIGALYAFHLKDATQQTAGLFYQGAAIGAVLAGDLLTLFIWWEITAIASVFLIWGSGVILLSGLLIHFHQTGSLEFGHLGLTSVATWLIFIAFGIKCGRHRNTHLDWRDHDGLPNLLCRH